MSKKQGVGTAETDGAPGFQDDMDALIEGASGLFDNLKDIFQKSREEVLRASQLGKARIDVFHLRKDREQLLQRLGEEAYELLSAGRLAHASLQKAAGKIRGIDQKIEAHEDQIAKLAEEPAEASPTGPTKKPGVKKAATKAASAKKVAPKKAPAKKAAAKPASAKKAAAKTASGKKVAPKKAPAKQAAPQQPPAKNGAAKTAAAKPAAPKKPPAKKAAAKPGSAKRGK